MSLFPNPPGQGLTAVEQKKFCFTIVWSQWFTNLLNTLNGVFSAAQTVTITTAKLTSGGTEGSMTFTNGILTKQTPAT
jgi:hypothetical protein